MRAVAVPPRVDDAVDPAAWMAGFEEPFAEVVAPFFYRREPRLRAQWYLLGLVSGLERKNGWMLAEFAGEATPDGMQRLLNAAVWDVDQVRDALRGRRSRTRQPSSVSTWSAAAVISAVTVSATPSSSASLAGR